MIAIIHKNKPTILNILFEIFALLRIKLHKLMPAEITEWKLKNIIAAEIDNFLLWFNRNRRVFDQRIQNI